MWGTGGGTGRRRRRRAATVRHRAVRTLTERCGWSVVPLLYLQRELPVPELLEAHQVGVEIAVEGVRAGRGALVTTVLVRSRETDADVPVLLVSVELRPAAREQSWTVRSAVRGSAAPVDGRLPSHVSAPELAARGALPPLGSLTAAGGRLTACVALQHEQDDRVLLRLLEELLERVELAAVTVEGPPRPRELP